jgi:flagellin-like protein
MVIDEDGVSPVIGTVLLVAITVIVAAIAGAYAFGFIGHTQTPRYIGLLTVNQDINDIVIQYHGGPDDESLQYLRIMAPDGTEYYSTESGVTTDSSSSAKPEVGSLLTLPNQATSDSDHVIVVAYFIDGYQQLIYEGWL